MLSMGNPPRILLGLLHFQAYTFWVPFLIVRNILYVIYATQAIK